MLFYDIFHRLIIDPKKGDLALQPIAFFMVYVMRVSGGVGSRANLAADCEGTCQRDGQKSDQDEAVVVAGLLDRVRGYATGHRGQGRTAEGKDQLARSVVDADCVIGTENGLEAYNLSSFGDIGDDFTVLMAGQLGQIIGTGYG